MDITPKDAPRLPEEFSSAKEQGLAEWMPLLYSELRRLASHYLQQERSDHTLQTTALVHEAYLRLADWRGARWENRNQFLGVAAQMMRRILVDYGRSHHAAKRGGNVGKVYLQEADAVWNEQPADVVALDAALTKLAELHPQHARIVEWRFFGGLSIEQVAVILNIAPATVKRNWNVAKAWLARELRRDGNNDA